MVKHKKVAITLCLALVLLFVNVSAFAQANVIRFDGITVQSLTTEITIQWKELKSNVYYDVSDEFGNSIYRGKKNHFTEKNLLQDSYKSYYLTGYNAKDNLITERVAITAKTKRSKGDQRSFGYMITTENYIILQWDPIKNKKESYKIMRDGVLLADTNDTTFKDSDIISGKKYSYSVETVVLSTQLNENGEEQRFDKSVTYQTDIDTARVNNDSSFSIASLADANIPTILFKTFIRASQIYDPQNYLFLDACGTDATYFNGNDRGFSYTSNSYKTKQQINLNFTNHTYSYSESAGQTHGWCKRSNGTTYGDVYATADMAESYVQNVTYNGTTSFSMNIILSENDPLVALSPSIDADIDLTVYKGSGASCGSTYYSLDHDGFPDYEIYRKDGTLTYNTIYTWDAAAHNDGIVSLFWPMEHSSSGTR